MSKFAFNLVLKTENIEAENIEEAEKLLNNYIDGLAMVGEPEIVWDEVDWQTFEGDLMVKDFSSPLT
jgi:hypothetical protein